MLACLLLQTSLLLHPTFPGNEPPELRSARNILLLHKDVADVGPAVTRTREEALELAKTVVGRARAGASFVALAQEFSQGVDARLGAVLGSFPQGALEADLDRFLFAAELGAVSEPLATARGVLILQRVDTWAAVRELRVELGADEAGAERKVRELGARLAQGADFAELAREHSSNKEAAARGGAFAIYERGARDTLLKAAAFELRVGEVSGPIRSPLGLHLLKRVPEAEIEAGLRENNWAHVRAILVQHDKAAGADPALPRTQAQAKALGEKLRERLKQGERFEALAAEFNDDPGGKERAGDLGWVHRSMPNLPRPIASVFLLRPGEHDLFDSPRGYVLTWRER